MKSTKILLREGLINEVNYPLANPPQYGDTDYKVRNGKIILMDPKTYLGLVSKLDVSDEESLENIDDLANMMNQGIEIDPPTLYLDGNQVVNHDGRHRAYAAIKLGMREVPVLLLDINNKTIPNTEFKPQIKEVVITESNETWYHGTPDVRQLEKDGGFTQQQLSIEYVEDINGWDKAHEGAEQARINGDEDEYFRLIDLVGKLRKKMNIKKPIFLSNNYSVAKSYADPHRSMDYQNSEEKVLKVKLKPSKTVTINATGDRFRFINIDKVRNGFLSAGVNKEELTIRKLNFAIGVDSGIKTDDIAAIGDWFGFDYIDILGVLDSYNGGTIKSTVRMVFNPTDIEIIK